MQTKINIKFFSISFTTMLIMVLYTGCFEPVQYPAEPQIDYQRMIVTNDSMDLLDNPVYMYDIIFNVLDGDSNVGLKAKDTSGAFAPDSKFYNNTFISIYQKVDGEFKHILVQVPVPGSDNDYVYDTVFFNMRIPHTEHVGLNKYFKAEVKVNITIGNVFFIENNIDSIKYVFQVADKDLNLSNFQETKTFSTDYVGTMLDTNTVIIY